MLNLAFHHQMPETGPKKCIIRQVGR